MISDSFLFFWTKKSPVSGRNKWYVTQNDTTLDTFDQKKKRKNDPLPLDSKRRPSRPKILRRQPEEDENLTKLRRTPRF